MTQTLSLTTPLIDLGVPSNRFRADVVRGLAAPHKEIPCKYFYDEAGSRLFDRICELDEYYPTRTERAIMEQHAPEMAALAGPGCLVAEYGSGSSVKSRLLLDHLESVAAYVPIDISREHLLASAAALAREYPTIEVLPVCADFTRPFELPAPAQKPRRRLVYFPGSTIGNFTPEEAVQLLRRTARLGGPGSVLLLGVDLKKEPKVLHAAYNDARGVTAAFNLNLLTRINRELGADFQVNQFWHYAFYNPAAGRIEMHLVSRKEQRVRIGADTFAFAEGESIRTEYSYKYNLTDLRHLASAGGFEVRQVWTDDRPFFCVLYLVTAGN
jgi:L-histidine Nalpha-methyltransferase